MSKPHLFLLCAASGIACVAAAATDSTIQTIAAIDKAATRTRGAVDEVVVTGHGIELDSRTETASRLGLSVRETPAAIEVITQTQIQEQGLRTLEEAYAAIPGVTAGNLPGEPGMTAMRGFSSSAIGYLFDGVRAADSSMMSRNFDTWNFEKIEVLKGPASVLYGAGSLAGTINLVPKKPVLGDTSVDSMISYGSFDSVRLGLGGNAPLGDRAAVRADVSHSQSSGYIDDTDSKTTAITTGLKFEATDRLTLSAGLDYYEDDYNTPYQGLPLIQRSAARDPSGIVSSKDGLVVDEKLRDKNYDVEDGLMDSHSWWLRTRVEYALTDRWQLANELSYYDADRRWRNSEDFSYNNATGLLDRTTTKIYHDHSFWSERAMASYDGDLGNQRNRFSIGLEYTDTDFSTIRRFGETTSVDPFDPQRGYFPDDNAANFPGNGNRVNFDSSVKASSAFFEDALNLTPSWLAVVGGRFDHIDLDRRVTDFNAQSVTAFGQTYDAASWRVGTVYDIAPLTQLYAQYNKAVAPVSSLLLSSMSRASFDLTTGKSYEAGLKTAFWDQRASLTTALYHIEQNDILTRDPANTSLTVQGGTQSSKGVEVALSVALTEQLRVEANAAWLKAEFDELREAGGADRAGNRPPNVPEQTYNASAYYTLAEVPLTASVSVQHAGDFYTSNANDYRVDGHTTLDAALSYRLSFGTLTLRGRNLTDEFYADWSGYSATQVYIGAPRSVDLTLTSHF
jgi:iron complex outermembrane receptor protein